MSDLEVLKNIVVPSIKNYLKKLSRECHEIFIYGQTKASLEKESEEVPMNVSLGSYYRKKPRVIGRCVGFF